MFTPIDGSNEPETDILKLHFTPNQILEQANLFTTKNQSCNKLVDGFNQTFDADDQLVLPDMFHYTPNSTNLNQFQSTSFTSNLNYPQTEDFFSAPSTIDSAILPQSIVFEHLQPNLNTLIPNKTQMNQNQSTSVVPVVYASDANPSLACDAKRMQNDLLKFQKIQIKCQPRQQFRPRTQNESKNSSHYLRCNEGAEHEYPTIYVYPEWARQSNSNLIEIALMDVNKEPHPYSLDNKNSRNSFDDEGCIFKQKEPNILYFRLTNDDFLRGSKTFMIEFIKRKQDEVITKNLIRLRKLDQSMLRFTRISRDAHGKYHRDVNGEEYSWIMTENYGDTSVEQAGPRYGPMSGQETMFIALKGRFTKEDLSVIITEPTTNWSQEIEKFTVNGTFVHFSMPAFPYPQLSRVNATVNIYFKQNNIHKTSYLYTNLLDQELAKSNSDMYVSSITNDVHQLQCGVPTTSQKPSKSRPLKRLSSK